MRHVVCMGGGGFSTETDALVDDYVLSLVPHRRKPRVCFVPTASGDSESYVARFEEAFPKSRADTAVLHLFKRSVSDIARFLLSQDVIYVGGGSTANLLALWRLHAVDEALVAAYQEGVVLAGVSAGMNCWFAGSVTDSFNLAEYSPLQDGLGLLSGSACPHYGSEEGRRELYLSLGQDGFPGGYAVNDSAALHFVNDELADVVTTQPGCTAFLVRAGDGAASEVELPATYLGRRTSEHRTTPPA